MNQAYNTRSVSACLSCSKIFPKLIALPSSEASSLCLAQFCKNIRGSENPYYKYSKGIVRNVISDETKKLEEMSNLDPCLKSSIFLKEYKPNKIE